VSAVAPAPERADWDGRGVTVDEVVDRLAEQRRPADGGAPFLLAGVLNLVAYADEPSGLDGLQEVIEHLADHQPSRSVVLCEQAGARGIDATVSTSCRIAGEQAGAVVELIRLTLRADAPGGAASATVPLLRSDLPTVLWWPSAPDLSAGGALGRLADIADRVITESGRGPRAAEAVRTLAGWVPDAVPAVTDLAWAAITGWRQLIAQMVEGPALDRLRSGAAAATITNAEATPCVDALLLAGWLRSLVGPGLMIETHARTAGGGAGLVAVELEGSANGRRLTVERIEGRATAAVCVTEPDGVPRRRVLPLPHPDRTRLLAGELELQRRDHAFERALQGAVAAGVA
jgi:hypothetical protein